MEHKYICSFRIKNQDGKKVLGNSMPCKMCCKRIKMHGIDKVIFYHDNNIVLGHIDDIQKYAVYTSGVNYSQKALRN